MSRGYFTRRLFYQLESWICSLWSCLKIILASLFLSWTEEILPLKTVVILQNRILQAEWISIELNAKNRNEILKRGNELFKVINIEVPVPGMCHNSERLSHNYIVESFLQGKAWSRWVLRRLVQVNAGQACVGPAWPQRESLRGAKARILIIRSQTWLPTGQGGKV